MGGLRLLLDTHALYWALGEPEQLGRDARAAIESRESVLYVSAVSAWEIATKRRLGKLPGADGVLRAYAVHLRRLGADELPISSEHALYAGAMVWEHRDPFDRMLASQAVIDDLVLVTRDREFTHAPGVRTLW